MKNREIREKHERFLYPVVRVYTKKAAGSGTVIWSKCTDKNCECDHEKCDCEFDTFVLTNHHVIDDCVNYKKEWDSVLKREIEKEFLEIPRVEIFDYFKDSTVVSSNSHRADIVAYDKNHDLAILKLQSPKKFSYVAELIPREQIKNLRLFMDVIVSGCSMGHEPFSTPGQLTFLKELIEQREYVMYNAASYFGNSGGALFLNVNCHCDPDGDCDCSFDNFDKWLIGVPSRLTGIQLGFGIDMVTHMGFAAHPERIYEFLDEQELKFFYDPNDTFDAAMERRKNKKRDALLELKAEIAKEGS